MMQQASTLMVTWLAAAMLTGGSSRNGIVMLAAVDYAVTRRKPRATSAVTLSNIHMHSPDLWLDLFARTALRD